MEITFNGEKEQLEKEYTITKLIEKYELNPQVVTVNLNGSILSKEAFDSTKVKEGDTVDVLLFMGGGN